MQSIHNVNLSVKVGDIEKRFKSARERYMNGEDDALELFMADFPENPHAINLTNKAVRERSERDYKAHVQSAGNLGYG